MELHYVNVVEVTAPGLDMRFLDTKVRPLLENTFSGTRFSGGVLPGVSMRCLDNTVWLLLEHTLSGAARRYRGVARGEGRESKYVGGGDLGPAPGAIWACWALCLPAS